MNGETLRQIREESDVSKVNRRENRRHSSLRSFSGETDYENDEENAVPAVCDVFKGRERKTGAAVGNSRGGDVGSGDG